MIIMLKNTDDIIFDGHPIGDLIELSNLLKELRQIIPWRSGDRELYDKINDKIFRLDMYVGSNMEVKDE